MTILGNACKGSVADRDSGAVLTMRQVSEIQKILLMMLEDIDRICRENHLRYVLIGGTAIGCVRHKGFIPWDDDVDIAMPRADYERFAQIINSSYAEKYSMTDALRSSNYGKTIPKLRLKGTVYKTLLEVEPEDKEISADVFIIENVEDSAILKYLHGFLCLVMGYCLSCRRLAERKEFFAQIYADKDFKLRTTIGSILKFASLEKWACWTERCYSMCRNDRSRYVTLPADEYHFFGEIVPREMLCETAEGDYEGHSFLLPREYDAYLRGRYGDYMKVPPEEQQVLSVYSELDYGQYQGLATGKA